MKKLWLVGILALAMGTAWLHADEGISFSGRVQTGFGFQFGDAVDDAVFYVGRFDPQGPTNSRASLNWRLDRENYGLRVDSNLVYTTGGGEIAWSFPNAFGWFTLMDDMLRITAGRIDTQVWQSPGAHDVSYSRGLGVRLEVTPMPELNVGLVLRANNSHPGSGAHTNDLSDAFLNTSLGFSFDAGDIVVAGGLELRSQGQERRGGIEIYAPEYTYIVFGPDHPMNGGTDPDDYTTVTVPGGMFSTAGDVGPDDVGISLYIGVGLNMIDDLSIGVGVELTNIDEFEDEGMVHIHQAIEFDMAPLTLGLDMHQRLTAFWADDLLINLEFEPWLEFALDDATTFSVAVPVSLYLWDGLFLTTIGFEPGVTHRLGSGMTIGAGYRLDVSIPDEGDNFVEHTLGVFFNWTF